MTVKKIILSVLGSLVFAVTIAQPYTNDTPALRKILHADASMDAALQHADLDGLAQWFAPDAVWLPEYHNALYTKRAILGYFRGWLDSTKILDWNLMPYEVQRIGHYLLETGNGRIEFLRTAATAAVTPVKSYTYLTKYLRYWRVTENGSIELLSTIMGSSRDLPRSDLPMSAFIVPDTNAMPHAAPSPIGRLVDILCDRIAGLVVSGDGASFAQYYTSDAIYMPYYSPMLIGKNALDAWYRQHESPKSDCMVRIRMTRIIEVGDYILADGYYQVKWGNGPSATLVSGKNMNIFERGKDGRLLIYRQMTAHD